MKMNKKITLWLKRSFTGRILFAMSFAASLLLTACVREMEVDDAPFRPGNRATATLTFDIKTSSTDVKTRSALDAGALKLETIWIGVFDTKTGEMLGYMADRPRKSDNTRVRMNDDSGTWTVEGMDIWYYDNNPEVYIASVVNYEFVQARKVGDAETTDLHKLLGIEFDGNNIPEVTDRITWEDLCAISVDTKSIDAAMKTASSRYGSSPAEELALAMGFFNTSAGVHTTIDREGKTPANARVSLAKNGTQYVSELHPEGRIYLRRMQSDIKININFAMTPMYMPYVVKEVKSLRYRVMNKPVEMYLAEHAVDKSGGSLSGKDNYLSRTANSADWLGDEGYESDDDDDWHEIDLTGPIEDGYSFTYSHYENKHWGLDWEMEPGTNFVTMSGYDDYYNHLLDLGTYDNSHNYVPDPETRTWKEFFDEIIKRNSSSTNFLRTLAASIQRQAAHRIREAKLADGVFKSLNKSEDSFNNNASYILLEADITWKSIQDGSLMHTNTCYTIHEGYTSFADGTPLPDVNRVTSKNDIYDAICDFQTVRNTKYTYNLVFSGISTIMMQAMADEMLGSSHTMHDDGYTGQASMTGGNITDVAGGGNIDIQGKGYEGFDLYCFYDPEGRENFKNFISMPLPPAMPTQYRGNILKWRLYEKRWDKDQKKVVEANYGTCHGNSTFDWPQMAEGKIGSLEELKALPDSDPMKKFYNSIKVHIGVRRSGYSSSYLAYESFMVMTLEEFFNGADKNIPILYNENFEYFITFDAYNVDDEISNFSNYKRGLYFVIQLNDDDACSLNMLVSGAEQGPLDFRTELSYFEPFYMQRTENSSYYGDSDFQVYSAAQNFSDTEYLYWFPGVSFYETEDDASLPEFWKEYWEYYQNQNGYEGNPHEPVSYTIFIDGTEKAKVDWDSEYRHINYYESGNPFAPSYDDLLHVPTRQPCYFAWPYNPNELTVGEHTVTIRANVDERFVQPAEFTTKLRIVAKPLWKFDNSSFPIYYGYDGDYFSYGSMTAVFGNSFYIYSNGYNNGYVQMGGYYNYGSFAGYDSNSNDVGIIRFKVDKHGTFRVRLNFSNYSNKRITFKARDQIAKEDYFYNNYGSSYIDVFFHTRDIIDNFDNGPVDVSLYVDSYYSSYSTYLYIYEIEWTTDDDQNPNYEGVINYSNEWKPAVDNEGYYMHPYYNYINYSGGSFYITPGLVNYFGFTDSKPRAQKYKVVLYNSSSSNATPVYEWEFDAAECLKGTDKNGTGYFVCPIFMPVGDLYPGSFRMAVTPVSDGYRESPTFMFNGNWNAYVVSNTNVSLDWWNSDYSTNSYSYPNPWYYYNYTYGPYFGSNANVGWSEFLGLVLHGGTGSGSIGSDYINFGGNGYPLGSQNPDFGRYLSFTTDMPGYVVLRASSTGSAERYFRLYKVDENGTPEPEPIDRKPIAASKAPFMLGTGPVEGLTTFIICPEGGVNLSGARFVYNEEFDDRESLDNSTLNYVNWSSDPEKPIHPPYYDYVYDYDGDKEDFDGYVYREFWLRSHFETLISFSDDNPRAASYRLQLFNEETFNPNNFGHPDFEAVIDPDTFQTYPATTRGAVTEGTKVFTYPLFVGTGKTLATGNYLVFVTPVGDPVQYKPAAPQFITLVSYYDWTVPYFNEEEPPYIPDEWEEYKDIFLSPGIGWLAEDFAYVSNDENGYPLPAVKNFYDGDKEDCFGMTLNGSSAGDGVRTINPAIRDSKDEVQTDWWLYFSGDGYPKANVQGRNLTFTTDMPGKILIFAYADTDDPSTRSYGLWKKSGESATQIGESKPVLYPRTAMNDMMKAIQLETGDVSGKTEFIICPEGGSYLGGILFFPRGSAAYGWDWEKDGWPGMSDPDDDDADGHSLVRTAPFNPKSAISLWTDRIPFPKKR